MSAFRAIVDIHLPEYVGGASEPVALLQAAGRWADAAALAAETAARVPNTREHDRGGRYLLAVAAAAHVENAVADGQPTVAPGTDADPSARASDEGPAEESPSLRLARGRAEFLRHLDTLPAPDPTAAAASADHAAEAMAAAAFGPRELWQADAYRCAAHLLLSDAAVRTASADAPTHLAAARRSAAVLAAAEGHLTIDGPVVAFARSAADPAMTDIDTMLRHLRRTPFLLPVWRHALRERRPAASLPGDPSGTRRGNSDLEGTAAEPTPTAVCVLSLDDDPVVDVAVLRGGNAYDLRIDLRIETWPSWADTCHVSLLSVHPPDALTVPQFTFTRADAREDECGLALSGTGTLYYSAQRAPGRPGIDLPLHVRFESKDQTERADTGGYRRLRVRLYDPSRDPMTHHLQMDQRLLELYDQLHDDRNLDQDDVAAFCRMFTACVRAAQSIMFDAAFRAGRKVTEAQFHDALEQRLREDPELEGRLSRRDAVAGGFDDLLHDDIIAELKVEKTTPRTVDGCARYIGQPTQYGVGRGSRLSILVVLDHSRKKSPPGVLENYIGWLVPRLHGHDDPRYPSRVGVLIINTNWPVPSAWSRRRIAVVDDTDGPR